MELEQRDYDNFQTHFQECNLQGKDRATELDLLCLCATIDMVAHLMLAREVNSVAALVLIDSGATKIFIHPEFAQVCHAELNQKGLLRIASD